MTRGLALVRGDQPAPRGDLLDALASLHRNRREFPAAITCARESLALREASGDLLAVAKSLGNLGLLYTGAGAYPDAVAAHREAMAIYRRLGHQEMMATAWLNIGMAQHLAGDRAAALAAYQACVALSREINLALAEVKALYNLAEANAELGQCAAAPAPQYGSLTPRLLMQGLGVSKPTATRRLRELTAAGLLAAHGKGRATCYAAVGGATVGEMMLAAELAALGDEMAGEYGLAALYVARTTTGSVDLAVRFQQLPDLQ